MKEFENWKIKFHKSEQIWVGKYILKNKIYREVKAPYIEELEGKIKFIEDVRSNFYPTLCEERFGWKFWHLDKLKKYEYIYHCETGPAVIWDKDPECNEWFVNGKWIENGKELSLKGLIAFTKAVKEFQDMRNRL